MIVVNATDFKNNLGQYLQKIYAEAVVVSKMGRPTAVLMSYEEYAKLTTAAPKETQTLYASQKEEALLNIRNELKRLRALRAEEHQGEQ